MVEHMVRWSFCLLPLILCLLLCIPIERRHFLKIKSSRSLSYKPPSLAMLEKVISSQVFTYPERATACMMFVRSSPLYQARGHCVVVKVPSISSQTNPVSATHIRQLCISASSLCYIPRSNNRSIGLFILRKPMSPTLTEHLAVLGTYIYLPFTSQLEN